MISYYNTIWQLGLFLQYQGQRKHTDKETSKHGDKQTHRKRNRKTDTPRTLKEGRNEMKKISIFNIERRQYRR